MQQEFITHAYIFSDIGALLHIVKSSLGAGVLAMPFAFKNAGLLIGVIGSIFIGITVTHCTTLLVFFN